MQTSWHHCTFLLAMSTSMETASADSATTSTAIQEGRKSSVIAAAASKMSQLDEFDGLDDIEAQIAALDEVPVSCQPA